MLGAADDARVRPGARALDPSPEGRSGGRAPPRPRGARSLRPRAPARRRPPPPSRVASSRQTRARSPPAVRKRAAATPTPQPLLHRGHLQIVAHDEAAEVQTAPEESRDDRHRQRGRPLGIERRIPHVGHHDRGASRGERAAERHQLVRSSSAAGDIDLREGEMGVDGRPPVTREVLGHGDQALRQGGVDERRRRTRRPCPVLRVRPVPDDDAGRIGAAVQDRREPGVEPRGAQLTGHRPGDQRRPDRGPPSDRPSGGRKARERRGKRWTRPPSWSTSTSTSGPSARAAPVSVRTVSRRRAVPREEHDAAQSGLARPARRSPRQRGALEPDREELAGAGLRAAPPASRLVIARRRRGHPRADGRGSRLGSAAGPRREPRRDERDEEEAGQGREEGQREVRPVPPSLGADPAHRAGEAAGQREQRREERVLERRPLRSQTARKKPRNAAVPSPPENESTIDAA